MFNNTCLSTPLLIFCLSTPSTLTMVNYYANFLEEVKVDTMSFTIFIFFRCEFVKCVIKLVCTFVKTSCLWYTLFRSNKYLGTIPLTTRWAKYFWITSVFVMESDPTTSFTMTMASFHEILTLTFCDCLQ